CKSRLIRHTASLPYQDPSTLPSPPIRRANHALASAAEIRACCNGIVRASSNSSLSCFTNDRPWKESPPPCKPSCDGAAKSLSNNWSRLVFKCPGDTRFLKRLELGHLDKHVRLEDFPSDQVPMAAGTMGLGHFMRIAHS